MRPPQTTAVRHAALAAAILAGTLAGALPRWGEGLVVASPPTHNTDERAQNWNDPVNIPPDHRAEEVVRDATMADRDAVPLSPEPSTSVAPVVTPSTAQDFDWKNAGRNTLAVLWLSGVMLLSVRLVRSAMIAARWRREARPLPSDEQIKFNSVRRELGVRRRVDAGLHPEPSTPLVLCGRTPLVLLPGDWMDWEDASRLAAARHELAHVKRRDDWWRVLSGILRTVWWFHPGVHWLLSRREYEAELLSDEAAVAGGCPPNELARILINACRRPSSIACAATAGAFLAHGTTKARIARLIETTSTESLCRPAPRALRFVAAASVFLLALAGSMRWVASAASAPISASATSERAMTGQKNDRVKVVVRLIDDSTGKPVVRAACEWGLANPANPREFIWGSRGEAIGSDGKLDMAFDLEHGRLIRMQVFAAGYERAEVVEEIPSPTPASLDRTIRLKRGPTVTGVLRDHAGKPVARGKVFFVPAGRAWQSIRIVEGVPDSPAVSETQTDSEGRFTLPADSAGMLAASTQTVDLWAFPLPQPGEHAELSMPAPAALAIDLAYWYLDAPGKTSTAASSDSDDPNQCWILINRLGTRDPLVDAIDYHRVLCVFARGQQATLSKGVSAGPLDERARPDAIPGEGRNRGTATTARVSLPPGRYLVQRLRAGAGAYAPIDRTTIELSSGAETSLNWTRNEGAAVRGTVRLPAGASFQRTPGEASRKLDWSIPTMAFVVVRSDDGKVRDAAKIRPDGGFFIATHLEPGAYKAETVVILPPSDRLSRGLAGPPPDLEGAQNFVVPAPSPNAAGSAPVNVDILVKARSERILAANAVTPLKPTAVRILPDGRLELGGLNWTHSSNWYRQQWRRHGEGWTQTREATAGAGRLTLKLPDGMVFRRNANDAPISLTWEHATTLRLGVTGLDAATKAHLDGARGKAPAPLAPGRYEVYIGVDLEEETGPNSINYLGGRHDLRGRATITVGADRAPPKSVEVVLAPRDDQGPDGRPPRRVFPDPKSEATP